LNSFPLLSQEVFDLFLQLDCYRGRDQWVSVWNNENEYENDEEKICLLCSFVKQNTDIEFLDLWFDCCRGRAKWVSMWNNENEYENNEEKICFTLLFCKA
jgi:hypothetical protein